MRWASVLSLMLKHKREADLSKVNCKETGEETGDRYLSPHIWRKGNMAYESRRWWDDPKGRSVMCNDCAHYHRDATCDAFPEGIPSEILYRGEHDSPFEGDGGIRFEPKKTE